MKTYLLTFTFQNRNNETCNNSIEIKAGDMSEAKSNARKQLKALHAIANPTFTDIKVI